MGLVVHHLGHSQSDRVVFLCEELEIPYELKVYKRSPVLSPPELKALHPLGAAPVIEDGNVRLAETEACFEYIINVHGDGRLAVKPTEKNYADYLYWFYLTNGTLQPSAGRIMTLSLAGIKDGPTYSRYEQKLHDIFKLIDERLGQTTWLAGNDFTAADIMITCTLTVMREFVQVDLSAYKNILGFLQRITARPSHQRAMQKGDPDIDITKFINGPPPPLFHALSGHK